MTSLMAYSQFLLSRLYYHFPSDLNNAKNNILLKSNSNQRETFSNGQYPVTNMDLSKGWSFKTSSSWVKRMFTGYLESCGWRRDGTGEHESWCHHLHWYFLYWAIFSSDKFLSFFYIGQYFPQTSFYLVKLDFNLEVMIWIAKLKSCQYCTYYSF